MNKYEILYILDNGLTDENKQKLIDKFTQIIESMKGKIVNLDKWGTKKFAYEINHKNEGYYFLMNVESDPAVPLEIERQVNITEGVVRIMIIKKDEFSVKKVKRVPKFDKPKGEDKEYGSPVIDGVSPEFGIVQNTDLTADEPNVAVNDEAKSDASQESKADTQEVEAQAEETEAAQAAAVEPQAVETAEVEAQEVEAQEESEKTE